VTVDPLVAKGFEKGLSWLPKLLGPVGAWLHRRWYAADLARFREFIDSFATEREPGEGDRASMVEDAVSGGYLTPREATLTDPKVAGGSAYRFAVVYRRSSKPLVFEEWYPFHERRKRIERDNPQLRGK